MFCLRITTMPTPQFWTSEDKIPIAQKKVSIPAENGLSYSANQKVNFHIPPQVGFIQPKESYLKFDVKIALPSNASCTPVHLQLDAETGGQCLIRDIRVSSGGAGNVLLEEISNYNTLVALRYDYETNDNLKKRRSLTEGTTVYNPQQRSTHGVKKTQLQNVTENPYWKGPMEASTTADFSDTDNYNVKCLLPLHTGIFQNDKVFPCMLTEGLRIEIILENSVNVFRMLDQTNSHRQVQANPVFHSTNGSDSKMDGFEGPAGATSVYVRLDNNIGADATVANCPFAVGETIHFFNVSDSREIHSTGDNDNNPTIASIAMSGGTGGHLNQNILLITLDNAFIPNEIVRPGYLLCSGAVSSGVARGRCPSYIPTYNINNCEMILQTLEMPGGYTSKLNSMMKEGGSMNYDFLSFTNYKISQPSGETVANLRLPLVESRAKSILCVPIDATIRSVADNINGSGTYLEDKFPNVATALADKSWAKNHSVRTGLVGIWDRLSQYQLMYDGKLNPNRKVECSRSASDSINQQPLIELEKALVMAGIEPHSFLRFKENFCLGRALSLQDGVYDARGKDFALQVEYQEVGLAPQFNKLWNCYCAHLRRMVIRGGALSIEV